MTTAVWQWFTRFFNFFPKKNFREPRYVWPTREQIERLPPFEPLGFNDIIEVTTPEAARHAYEDLAGEEIVGFDTESKPTFLKGEVSTGPHVVQFSTLERAYVFMLHEPECRRAASRLIALDTLRMAGFGLIDDVRRIRIKLGVEPQAVVELQTLFAEKGYGRGVGAKVGVAMALKRKLSKSSRAQTSNWGARRLTDKQVLYAANDAYAAIRVYHALTSA